MLVVLQHWLVVTLAVDGGTINLDRTLVLQGWWPATWVTQVMPVVFFTAAAAVALGLRGRLPDRRWLAHRLLRLTGGVVTLVLVCLPLPVALRAAGLDEAAVSTGGRLIGALLWFLVVLVLLTAATGPLLRIGRRLRGAEVPILAVAAVLVDLARFQLGWPWVGYLNALLVWGAVYAAGLHYPRLRRAVTARPATALVAGAAGLALLIVLVTVGGYPAAMIGLPGTAVSNINPPSVAVLALALAQLGLLLALRRPLARWASRPRITGALDRIAPHTMAIYLWHTPAAVLVAAAAVALGWRAPAIGTVAWGIALLGWLVPLAACLLVLVRFLDRSALAGPSEAPHPARLAVGTVAVTAGLLTLTVGGLDHARLADGVGPITGTWALVAGALLLGGRPRPGTASARPARVGGAAPLTTGRLAL